MQQVLYIPLMIVIFQGIYKNTTYNLYGLVPIGNTSSSVSDVRFLTQFDEIVSLLVRTSTKITQNNLRAPWVAEAIKNDPYVPLTPVAKGYTSFQTTISILKVLGDISKQDQRGAQEDYTSLSSSMTQAVQNKHNDNVTQYMSQTFVNQENTVQRQADTIAKQKIVIDKNQATIDGQLAEIEKQQNKIAALEGTYTNNETEKTRLDTEYDNNVTLINNNDVSLAAQQDAIDQNNLFIAGQERDIAANQKIIDDLVAKITAQEKTISDNVAEQQSLADQKKNIDDGITAANTTLGQQQPQLQANANVITQQTNILTSQTNEITRITTYPQELSETRIGNQVEFDNLRYHISAITSSSFNYISTNQADGSSQLYSRRDLFRLQYIVMPTIQEPLSFKQPNDVEQIAYNIEYSDCLPDPSQLTKKILTMTQAQQSSITQAQQSLAFSFVNAQISSSLLVDAFAPLNNSLAGAQPINSLRALQFYFKSILVTLEENSNFFWIITTNTLTNNILALVSSQKNLTTYTMKLANSIINTQGFSDLIISPLKNTSMTLVNINIDLQNIVYRESALAQFFGAVAQCQMLTSLSLNMKVLDAFSGTADGIQYMSAAITSLPLLSSLSIIVSKAAQVQNSFCEDFFLAFSLVANPINIEIFFSAGAVSLSKMPVFQVLARPTLKSFSYTVCDITLEQQEYQNLASALQGNTTLTKFIFLPGEVIALAAHQSILTSLTQCPLTIIDYGHKDTKPDVETLTQLAKLLNAPSVKNLTELRIYWAIVDNPNATGPQELFDAVGSLSSLQYLTMYVAVDDTNIASVISCFRSLGGYGTLKDLTFVAGPNSTEWMQGQSVTESLASLRALEILTLYVQPTVAFTPSQFTAYQDILAGTLMALQSLDTMSLYVDSPVGATNNPSLATSLGNMTSLRQVVVSFSNYLAADAAALLNGITSSSISSINIGYSATSPDVTPYINAMTDFATRSQGMTSMIFNQISTQSSLASAWKYFADNAVSVSKITSFVSTCFCAQDDSVSQAYRVFSLMPCLATISFASSSVFDDAAYSLLFRSLCKSSLVSLTLSLDYYQFTAAAATSIALVINSNKLLQTLCLTFGTNCGGMTDTWLNSCVAALQKSRLTRELQMKVMGLAPALTDASLSNLYAYLNLRLSLVYYDTMIIEFPSSGASAGMKAQFGNLPKPQGMGYSYVL